MKHLFLSFRSRGFTLIELLVVIAIIGILAAIVLTQFSGVRARSRDAQRLADISQIRGALEIYANDNQKFPNTSVDPDTWACVATSSCFAGGYSSDAELNTILIGRLQKIPTYPPNRTTAACAIYDSYLYHPSVGTTVGITGAAVADGGDALVRPAGAYLHWFFEQGELSNKSCGEGFYGGAVNGCPYCWLALGK